LRNVAHPLNQFHTLLVVLQYLLHTACYTQFLAQRITRDRENMKSVGTKTSVYRRTVGREEEGADSVGRQRLLKLSKAL
jgi:hypothetical protein